MEVYEEFSPYEDDVFAEMWCKMAKNLEIQKPEIRDDVLEDEQPEKLEYFELETPQQQLEQQQLQSLQYDPRPWTAAPLPNTTTFSPFQHGVQTMEVYEELSPYENVFAEMWSKMANNFELQKPETNKDVLEDEQPENCEHFQLQTPQQQLEQQHLQYLQYDPRPWTAAPLPSTTTFSPCQHGIQTMEEEYSPYEDNVFAEMWCKMAKNFELQKPQINKDILEDEQPENLEHFQLQTPQQQLERQHLQYLQYDPRPWTAAPVPNTTTFLPFQHYMSQPFQQQQAQGYDSTHIPNSPCQIQHTYLTRDGPSASEAGYNIEKEVGNGPANDATKVVAAAEPQIKRSLRPQKPRQTRSTKYNKKGKKMTDAAKAPLGAHLKNALLGEFHKIRMELNQRNEIELKVLQLDERKLALIQNLIDMQHKICKNV